MFEAWSVWSTSSFQRLVPSCSPPVQRPAADPVAPPAGGMPGDPTDVRGRGAAPRPRRRQRPHRRPGDAPRLPRHVGLLAGQRHRPLALGRNQPALSPDAAPPSTLGWDSWPGKEDVRDTRRLVPKAKSPTASCERWDWRQYYYPTF